MAEKKNTLIIGASLNPERYSNRAILMLREYHHPVLAIGAKPGQIEDVKIQVGQPAFEAVDTISLYLSPENQKTFYDYILGLNPMRIIFNPGAENPELERLAQAKGIKTLSACTLVLLRTGQY